ncbi:GNAT family N-acetyltransferase [Corynebacterium pacaense]|uniref:GNAT family N-acetyltransferase n=1 Tax=Corynebacterium pacaense TaxID=1816684 RepID=UPI0009BC3B02|nr:GNAT family N-acetyltransferase [Corynebacterium pacaense]
MSLLDRNDNEVIVTNNESRGRYEISYPGDSRPAGFADYITRTTDDNDERLFIHTEIAEELGGRGLASILVGEALSDTLPTGLTVVTVCPFVKSYIERNGYAGSWRDATDLDRAWIEDRVIPDKGLN